MMMCATCSCRTFVKAVKPALEDGDVHCFLVFQCTQLKPKSKPLLFLGVYK
jgi:hypothetical protein